MNWEERVQSYLEEAKDPDRVSGGYKALATRLSKDLNKDISPSQVKSYMKKMEKKDMSFFKNINNNYLQKIFIHFGNKLRIYERFAKEV